MRAASGIVIASYCVLLRSSEQQKNGNTPCSSLRTISSFIYFPKKKRKKKKKERNGVKCIITQARNLFPKKKCLADGPGTVQNL